MSVCYESQELFDMTKENAAASSVLARLRTVAVEEGKEFKKIAVEILDGDYNNMVDVVEREFGHRFIVMAETK